MSKAPSQWAQGIAPTFVARGSGPWVWDVDGRRFLDFPAALGPIMLGYGHPRVDEAIRAQLADGITFTLPHPLEVEVAERIAAVVPGAERVRFGKTGSDATSAAVRLARRVTGRDRVVSAGYHGWHDWYIGTTSRRGGVPDSVAALIRDVPIHDPEAVAAALAAWRGDVACVIVEPLGVREPGPGVLQAIVDVAHEHGALAILDEVVTGFRLAPGGAQERYNVVADLACFGKALGNGMPISAVAGPADPMDRMADVFFSGTHGGEALSLAAARATLDVLADEPVHFHLWRLGTLLQDGLRELVDRHALRDWVTVGGAAPWTLTTVREPVDGDLLPAKTLLQQELLKRGVLYNGSHFISWAHAEEHIHGALNAYDGAFAVLASALPDGVEAALEAPPLSPVFRAVT
jgi:glutamate-1-semialdehyde 2,1-aminomutase/spore coat polysaccharide biosynthesis protein SpsF